MGTPEFAVETLQALVEHQYNVVAVVTQPDKPVGRHGSVLQPSAVKQYALEKGLPVLQPEKMKDPAFVETLRSYQANMQVVVAFRMLPEVVWAMPEYGTFNVHAALLPQYRGQRLSTGPSSTVRLRLVSLRSSSTMTSIRVGLFFRSLSIFLTRLMWSMFMMGSCILGQRSVWRPSRPSLPLTVILLQCRKTTLPSSLFLLP